MVGVRTHFHLLMAAGEIEVFPTVSLHLLVIGIVLLAFDEKNQVPMTTITYVRNERVVCE